MRGLPACDDLKEGRCDDGAYFSSFPPPARIARFKAIEVLRLFRVCRDLVEDARVKCIAGLIGGISHQLLHAHDEMTKYRDMTHTERAMYDVRKNLIFLLVHSQLFDMHRHPQAHCVFYAHESHAREPSDPHADRCTENQVGPK